MYPGQAASYAVTKRVMPATRGTALPTLKSPPSTSGRAGSPSKVMTSVVVGSADFPESKIVAEIYAAALAANGLWSVLMSETVFAR